MLSDIPGTRIVGTKSMVQRAGGDGYAFMLANVRAGWETVPDWGQPGWNMGRWPAIIIMVYNQSEKPRALVYVEGDVRETEFVNDGQRTIYLNRVAEHYWRTGQSTGPVDIASYPEGKLPPSYGGYSLFQKPARSRHPTP